MARVSLSLKSAREFLAASQGGPVPSTYAVGELSRALAPKPKSSAVRKTESRKRSKAAETRTIRAAVMARADGRCECCGAEATDFDPLELEHMHGKVRVAQSIEACWAVRASCHRAKTAWKGGQAEWLGRFLEHCFKRGISGPALNYACARLDALRLGGRAKS